MNEPSKPLVLWFKRLSPWIVAAGLLVLLIVVAVAWARAVPATEGERLKLEADALRRERDTASAARKAIDERLAKDGYRSVAARQALERGRALAETGRLGEGLLWMARSLSYAKTVDTNLQRIIRLNLDAWSNGMACLENEHSYSDNSLLHPDDQIIAAPSAEGEIRLLNVVDGKPSGPGLATSDLPLLFSGDGRRLLVRGPEELVFRAWDLGSGSPLGPAIPLPQFPAMPALNRDGSMA